MPLTTSSARMNLAAHASAILSALVEGDQVAAPTEGAAHLVAEDPAAVCRVA